MTSELELLELTLGPKFKQNDKVKVSKLLPDSPSEMKEFVGKEGWVVGKTPKYYRVAFDQNRLYKYFEFETVELERA